MVLKIKITGYETGQIAARRSRATLRQKASQTQLDRLADGSDIIISIKCLHGHKSLKFGKINPDNICQTHLCSGDFRAGHNHNVLAD